MEKKEKVKIPSFFKPILWSHNLSSLDPQKNKRVIIVNTINYGDLKHWRWLAHFYGKDEIKKILEEIPATELRPKVRFLAKLLFSVKEFNYAPRGIKH